MGRKPKYDEGLLISLVQEFLPDGALGWKTVAEHYHVNSGEKELRDHECTLHRSSCTLHRRPLLSVFIGSRFVNRGEVVPGSAE